MELILVMLIIAIISGMLVPSLARFTAGRAVDNLGRQILALAQSARSQSISQARIYRLNFDQSAGQFWLTADAGGGTFNPPTGGNNTRYSSPTGVRMQVTVTPQPNTQLLQPDNVQQQQVQQSSTTLDGQAAGVAGQIVNNTHAQGQVYVEFQPTGRTDPATIRLDDAEGHSVQIVCASPTDGFQIGGGAQ
jgi:Tfp pilus assembly protein FimT